MTTGSPGLTWYLIGFLLVIGPLIFVHELGHYFVARWFGVKAEAFSIGFGREIGGWTDRRGTRWKIGWLPLGGYVRFAGDMSPASEPSREWLELPPEERARTFQAKPLWQRFLIVLAGPLTNIVFAILILCGFLLAFGAPRTAPVVDMVVPKSAAAEAGIRRGDRIVSVGGERVDHFEDIGRLVVLHEGEPLAVRFVRDGREQEVVATPKADVQRDDFGNEFRRGLLGISYGTPPIIDVVMPNSAAAEAGLRRGDRIVAVGGKRVDYFEEIGPLVSLHAGRPVAVRFLRDGREQEIVATPKPDVRRDKSGKVARRGLLGISPSRQRVLEPVPLTQVVPTAIRQTWMIVTMSIEGVGQIISGRRSLEELGGPLKIAKFSGEQASLGPTAFISFVALISINLGFINLLPIPLLDGGHLLFYMIEGIRRKPLGPEAQEWAFRTGLAVLLALMIFVTLNDLASFGLWSKLGGLIG